MEKEKNKKKTLTISGGLGKKYLLLNPGLNKRKNLSYLRKNHKAVFQKEQIQVFQNHLISQTEKIFQENLLNNKLQKDLFIQIIKKVLRLN